MKYYLGVLLVLVIQIALSTQCSPGWCGNDAYYGDCYPPPC